MAAIAVAILVHEWRASGRISNTSKIGAGVIFAQQLLHAPVANSPAFIDFTSFVSSLIYYR